MKGGERGGKEGGVMRERERGANGKMERWKEWGKWGDGEMGRWRDGDIGIWEYGEGERGAEWGAEWDVRGRVDVI